MSLVFALLFAVSPIRCSAASGHEPSLEAPVESLLADLLGPGKARVFVRVERAPASAVRGPALWSRMTRLMKRSPQVLPGYALPKSLQAQALGAAAASGGRRLVVTVVLDGAVGEKEASAALATASEVLGLDAARGDRLKVVRAELRPANSGDRPILPVAASLGGLALAAGAAVLWRRRRRQPGPAQAQEEAIADMAASPALFFAFLDLRHAAWIADFLSRQGPLACAAVLRRLRLPVAAEVFRRLPPSRQRATAQALAFLPGVPGSKEVPDPAVRVQEYLRARAAGPGLLEDLLLRCPEWAREGVLAYLDSAAPEAAASLRLALPSWKDLSSADPASLRQAMSRFSSDELAVCLFDETEASPLLALLPPAVGNLIRRKLRTAVPASLDQAERLRAELLARWKKIRETGADLRLAPGALALLLFCAGASACGSAGPRPAPRTTAGQAAAAPRTAAGQAVAAPQTGLLKAIGLEGSMAESELLRADEYGGEKDARTAAEAFGAKEDLKAVLFAQAALGADPGNRSRRSFLRLLSERTGIAPDPEGLLPRAALIQHELTKADQAFFEERFGAAMQACRRALFLDPGKTAAWLRLGSTHLALGNKDQARGAYLQALKLDPKDRELQEFLAGPEWEKK